MKFIIALVVLCNIECIKSQFSIAPYSYVQHPLYEPNKPRAVCTVYCNYGSYEHGNNWVMEIAPNVHIGYSKHHNTLAIVNLNIYIATVFHGKTGTKAFFNLNTKSSIVMNLEVNVGVFVRQALDSERFARSNFFPILDNFVDIVVQHREKLTENTNRNIGYYFDTVELSRSVQLSVGVRSFFRDRKELGSLIYQHYSSIFNYMRTITSKAPTMEVGTLPTPFEIGIGAGMKFGTNRSVLTAMKGLLVSISLRLKGRITQELVSRVYRALNSEVSVELELRRVTHLVNAILWHGSVSEVLKADRDGYIPTSTVIQTKIKSTIYRTFTSVREDKSWYFGISTVRNVGVIFQYNAVQSSFMIYNQYSGYALVFDGREGLFGLSNARTGAIIVVNQPTGYARYVKKNTKIIIDSFRQRNILLGTKYIMEQVRMKTSIEVTEVRTFNFAKLVDFDTDPPSYDEYFSDKMLQTNVESHFGSLLRAKTPTRDIFSIISALLGDIKIPNFATGVHSFVENMYSKFRGYFGVNFMTLTFSRLITYVKTDYRGTVFSTLNNKFSEIAAPVRSLAEVKSIATNISMDLGVSMNLKHSLRPIDPYASWEE